MKEGLDAIFFEVSTKHGTHVDADGELVISVADAATWVDGEFGGDTPTPQQKQRAVALAQQLGAGRFVFSMKHKQRLDYIMEEITKHLTDEWDDPVKTEQNKKFLEIYGGTEASKEV